MDTTWQDIGTAWSRFRNTRKPSASFCTARMKAPSQEMRLRGCTYHACDFLQSRASRSRRVSGLDRTTLFILALDWPRHSASVRAVGSATALSLALKL